MEEDSDLIINQKIEAAHSNRCIRNEQPLKFIRLAEILRNKKDVLGRLITAEMGKPIQQSIAEVEKCAWCCEFYAEHAESWLVNRVVQTDAAKSYVTYEPFGVWLAIMPWNYPFWQVIRCAVPAMLAGNNVLLKHASNVQMCADALAELFIEAGFASFQFQVLHISSAKVEGVIERSEIKGISLTGSVHAGKMAASIAAKNLKPHVLELGGSNAFIITEDADIKKACAHLILGRFQNNGQSCIAAKRLIVNVKVINEVKEIISQKIKSLIIGNPQESDVYIGPLADVKFAEELESQVAKSVAEGAKIITGGIRENALFQPTLLDNVTSEMTCMKEELFGPVIPIVSYENFEDAIRISNNTDFGLGVSIFTEKVEKVLPFIEKFEEGAVFINSIVKSDPRLPFGGVKQSGYGRELSKEGLLSFCNIKTVFVA
ncbi:MAG: aldehyde dehydrogenase family protein [Flavobacteriales bacterium]